MTRPSEEALGVLRQVWSAQQEQDAEVVDVDENTGFAKACKRMTDVGFGGFAEGDQDLRTAWRSRLEREGKLGATSIRDLVLGPETAR